ncbi:MAG: hypothetical protein ACI4RI_07470 [Ruminococcus sp.]
MKYSSLTEYKKPCQQISSVLVMLDGEKYDYEYKNDEVDATGVVRSRYIDGTMDSNTPAVMAEDMINRSNCNYLSAKLTCPGCLADAIGGQAKVDYDEMEGYTFIITELKYVLNSKGENTTLVLERKM